MYLAHQQVVYLAAAAASCWVFKINKKRVEMLHAKFSIPTYDFTQCIVLLLCRSIYIPDAASYVGGCV